MLLSKEAVLLSKGAMLMGKGAVLMEKGAVSICLGAMLVCQKICHNVWLVTCYVEKGWSGGGKQLENMNELPNSVMH